MFNRTPASVRHARPCPKTALESGFTLPELMIVVAIIGLLSALLIGNMMRSRDRAYDTNAMNCNRSILTAQYAERAEGRPFKTQLSELDQGMVAACTDVEVAAAGPGGRNVSGTNTITVSATGEDLQYVTWVKRGTAVYVTDTAAGKQVDIDSRF